MKDRIQIIDGLRGIAILGVIWHHLYSHITHPGFVSWGSDETPFLPLTFLANGWLGVNLFFVLSGFVLFYPYVTEKRDFSTFSRWWAYYKNRARRLLPLYYFSVIYGLIFIAQPESNEQWIRHGLLMLTATFNFTTDLWYPPYNWVMWSLGIEIWFSIIFPLIVILTKKISVPKLGIAIFILALATRYYGLEKEFLIPGSPYLGALKDSLIGRLDDFFLGMFIAWYWIKSPSSRSSAWGKASVIVSGLALLFISSHMWDYFKLKLISDQITPLINNVLLAGIFLIIMYLLNAKSLWVRLITWKPIVGAGIICYSLYLWHGVILVQMLGKQRELSMVFFYLLAVFFISWTSYVLIERNKWFRPLPSHAFDGEPPKKKKKKKRNR